jgi:hypothetical protein
MTHKKGLLRGKRNNNRLASQIANMECTTGNESVQESQGPSFDSQVSIRIDHFRVRLADPGGISEKAAIDGVVNRGILRDDSTKEIAEPIVNHQHKVKNAEDEKTVITITEVTPCT